MHTVSHIDLWSMFMLGFMGTGHCIGMCGPLVVALPGQTGKVSSQLSYNMGRIATYGLVGGMMGLAGSGLTHLALATDASPMIWVARTQVAVSLLAATVLLLLGFTRLGLIREPAWLAIAVPQRIPGMGRLLGASSHAKGPGWMLVAGAMLGLLPCGLSYAAFARALAAGGFFSGMVMAVVFGAGTLPGLLLVGTGATPFFRKYREHTEMIAGLIMIAMGAKLIASIWMHDA